MIPSLAAEQLRRAVIEYLTTTFAIGDAETREALERFLEHDTDGIFRGPFLRVRTPLKRVEPDWRSPLDVLPSGWQPFLHQAKAYERLSSRDGTPQPTLVTTGTGSGKTEAFIHPILDHCARAAEAGVPGIKAIVLYPMNALATDQAGRLAAAIAADPRLERVSAGIYIGGEGDKQAVMAPDRIIDDRDTLKAAPPDILLTNYKMLDFLLLRDADRELWAETGPDSLRYVVLDEFHTYDGAQGTDVAMLLRRLGVTLGVAEPGRPLGRVAPVATSATLGDATETAALRDFAERVFGVPFDEEAVIQEERQSVAECCRTVDFGLPVPELDDLLAYAKDNSDDLDQEIDPNAVAAFFLGREPDDVFDLGEALLAHRLTRAVLVASAEKATPIHEALEEIVQRAPEWGAEIGSRRAHVERAIVLYLALLSIARRPHPAGKPEGAPLFPVEVQLWIREVSRVVRQLRPEPVFNWLDGAAPELEELPDEPPPRTAPAIYCRQCGRTGWMARAAELDGALSFAEARVYEDSLRRSPQLRALIRASVDEDDVRHLDLTSLTFLSEPSDGALPVLVTPGEDEARRSECPSCRSVEGIRFLGSRVASLASVSISQLFGSPFVGDRERKLLAFTDAVQDASHRAAFFNGRTHRFNLRISLASLLDDSAGVPLPLAGFGERLLAAAEEEREPRAAIHGLVPPDLLRHEGIRTLWEGGRPKPQARKVLAARLDFEAHLEFGSRARLGRTLELSRALAAEVAIPELWGLIDEIRAEHTDPELFEPDVDPDPDAYLRGLLQRLRLQGAIFHPWLGPYLRHDGKRWHIWGGRPDGMPAFARGQSVPTFLSSAREGPFDLIAGSGTTPTWLADWAQRTLGIQARAAGPLNRAVLKALALKEVINTRRSAEGHDLYGLDPERILIYELDFDEREEPSTLSCNVCAQRHVAPPQSLEKWEHTPCLRYRCRGRYESVAPESGYYRSLYRSGILRRVVAAEHTGGLARQDREALERAFKEGHGPGTPNVLSCTPTLEMGVDIGDLSAVMLTSVPRSAASYVQRVGRAGRASGNALVTTFVRTEPRGLYFLSEPRHLIAGAVRPPNCWLDAIEILRRQYFAFVLDRAADGTIAAPAMPNQMGKLAKDMTEQGGFLRTILDAHGQRPGELLTLFLGQFNGQVSEQTAERLGKFAREELDGRVEAAIAEWQGRYDELLKRRGRLTERINELEVLQHRSEEEETGLKALNGERKAIVRRFQAMREEYVPTALERLGLLPNYTLADEGVVLDTALWSKTDDGDYRVERNDYSRPATLAMHELAPGARFYANGHRHTVDALDLGPSSDPGYEEWRLCPDCGYGEREAGPPSSCPRCDRPAIADAQSVHTVLPFRRVSSLESEEQARVSDDQDERERTPFTVLTTVDVDPDDVKPGLAWRLDDETRPFGVEYASATLRWLNLGRSDRQGDQVRLAGSDNLRASRFETCRYCGVVQGARDDAGRAGAHDAHRGFCPVRSGARAPKMDHPVLMHELRTDVVRLLLPLADFEVRERLASFRAALLFGLQLDFGGDPDHLRVITADAPGGEDGRARRRFLVVHDVVPGGTGYLERLARADDLHAILERARNEIARCPCRDEGRSACHRCLLGHADHGDTEVVSRRLALELLDDLLGRWAPVEVPTIGKLPIGSVEESELERRLRFSLIRWAEETEGASVKKLPGTGEGTQADLELRIPAAADEGQVLRYLVREQVALDTTPMTKPDFVIRRMDAPGAEIAVYSDGFAYHAHPSRQATLRDDARKRHGVRSSGRLVWSMDYNDVTAFQHAVESPLPKHPPDRALLGPHAKAVAQELHHKRGGRLPVDLVGQNALRQLLGYLADPDLEAWRRLARSAVGGLVAGTVPMESPGAKLFSAATLERVRLDAALDVTGQNGANAERWTVRLVLADDQESMYEPDHRDRWRDWLHWGNLLQFLEGDGCQALVTVAAEEEAMADDLSPISGPTPIAGEALAAKLAPALEDELEMVDDAARDLVRQALLLGAPAFVAGHELDDGTVLEAAWPKAKVAVVLDGEVVPDEWTAKPPEAWDAARLADAAKGES